MGAQRQSRIVRRAVPNGLYLQDRDLAILEALGKMRFAETHHLATLFFRGSRSATNKRLRKLMDRKLIRAWVRDLAKDNLYSLDRMGRKLLNEEDDGPLYTVPRGLDGIIDHLLMINTVRVSMATRLARVGGRLVWWRTEFELRGRFAERVIPDALFAIRWDELTDQVYSLEVDNETRSPRAFVKKLLGYEGVLVTGGFYGVQTPIVLAVSRRTEGVERYRSRLVGTGLGSNAWFASLDDVCAVGAVGGIWHSLRSEEPVGLRDALASPNRTERARNVDLRHSDELAG